MNLFSLEGKVALVTGAGRGIGRGIAEGLAAAGAKIVAAGRTRSQLDDLVGEVTSAGGDGLVVEMDVSDLGSIREGVEAAVNHFGGIDILVNNAGVNKRVPLVDVTEEIYDQIVDVNQKGLYFVTQAVVKHMIKQKAGKIINIGSLTSGRALGNVSVYTSSKGAVGMLTKSQALEFAPHNIQVNAICPGFVYTALAKSLWDMPEMNTWGETRIPAGRLANPDDMAGTAIYLASAASDYVTGQLIYVDGGFEAGEDWPIDPPNS